MFSQSSFLRTHLIGDWFGGAQCQTVNTLQNFKETDDSTPNQDNACLKCLASACSHNTRLLKACVYISLGMGGQFSVYAARTHKFFFSRRPGYALLLMSGLVSIC